MKTKYSFILALSVFLISCRSNIGGSSRKHSDELRVDSFFKKSFSDINKSLVNHHSLNKEEKNFVYLISYFSGIAVSMDSGYLGTLDFDKKNLLIYENWYDQYKTKIEWSKVQKGLKILDSEAITNSKINEIRKLQIK